MAMTTVDMSVVVMENSKVELWVEVTVVHSVVAMDEWKVVMWVDYLAGYLVVDSASTTVAL